MKGRQDTKPQSKTKYTFETSSSYQKSSSKFGRRSEHADDVDPTDGSGSLTYSAASSIHSGGESSNESSFADIMKVLDGQDSSGLAAYLKERESQHHHKSHLSGSNRDERSVANESLAYSTDAESHVNSLATGGESALHGTYFVGERHDERLGGGQSYGNEQDEDVLFAPAEYSDSLKRRKAKKRQEKSSMKGTPRWSFTAESRQGTPPTPSRRPPTQQQLHHQQQSSKSETTETNDDEVWYAKWWM